MRTILLSLACAAALVPLGGCATYEYDLVQPSELARHIGRKAEEHFYLRPLDYWMISYENYLIVRVGNPTDDPIHLLGAESTAVDPHGQSHPLRSQTIAPHTWIKLILPPLPPGSMAAARRSASAWGWFTRSRTPATPRSRGPSV